MSTHLYVLAFLYGSITIVPGYYISKEACETVGKQTDKYYICFPAPGYIVNSRFVE